MDRRAFLAAIGAATVIVRPAQAGRSNPLTPIGAGSSLRPAGAGLATSLDRIGLQLYTVRAEMATSVERTLYEVGRIGYRDVEFAGYFNRPPRAIRQLLDRNNLKSPSGHVSLDVLRGGWYRALSDAAEIGQKWLVIPSLPESDRNSIDAIKHTAELLNRSAEDAKSYKIRVAFHNHDVEFQEVEGRRVFDVLLAETDPELVDFELDLYWITKAGADPLEYITQHPKRFPLVHVKDSTGDPEHEMIEVGRGKIDFARLFAAGEKAGMKHFYVEHDRPADPLSSARISYRYLDSLEF